MDGKFGEYSNSTLDTSCKEREIYFEKDQMERFFELTGFFFVKSL